MKLLIFTPCEKVLQDARSGHSLINVFNELKIQVPPNTELPSDAVIPKEWAIFTKWELDAEDEGKECASVLRILWPDGKVWAEQTLSAPPTKGVLSFMVQLQGFPFGQNGKLRVVNSLRSGDFPISTSDMHIGVIVTKDLITPTQQNP